MSDVNPTPSADPVEAVKDTTNPIEAAKPKVEDPIKPVIAPEGEPETPEAKTEPGGKPEEKMVTVKALHEAKNENKELKEKLAEIEATKKAEAEKTLAEQGKYEDLANQYKTENEELKAKNESYKSNSDKFEDMLKNEIAEYMAKIPDEKNKTLVQDIISGKTLIDQRKLMPQLAEKFGVPTSVNQNIDDTKTVDPESAEKKAKYNEAKKVGSIQDLLRLAPEKQ